MLAESGIAEPLAAYERAEEARVEGERARKKWVDAAPVSLRATLETLEGKAMGSPKEGAAAYKDAVATMRAATSDRESVARNASSCPSRSRPPGT